MKERVLVVDFKHEHPDNTCQAFYHSIEKFFDVLFYGPGYIPIDLLEESLVKVVEKHGPFKAIFISRHVLYYVNPGDADLFDSDLSTTFFVNRHALKIKKPRFGYDYHELSSPLFLVMMNFDFYIFNDWHEYYLKTFPGFLILPPPQTVRPISELKGLESERFYNLCSDRYLNFSKKHHDKIIPLPHLLCDNEIFPIQHKGNDVCVPGVLYAGRKDALKKFKYNGISVKDKYLYHKLALLLHKTRVVTLKTKWLKGLHKKGYRDLIASSYITYADGSKLRMFLKKAIEIPAFGSLEMCDPFNDMNAFGFINGVNCVYVSPDTLVEVCISLLKDKDKIYEITKQGHAMVTERYTSTGFAETVKQMVDLACANRLCGGLWEGGFLRFKLNQNEFSNTPQQALAEA